MQRNLKVHFTQQQFGTYDPILMIFVIPLILSYIYFNICIS